MAKMGSENMTKKGNEKWVLTSHTHIHQYLIIQNWCDLVGRFRLRCCVTSSFSRNFTQNEWNLNYDHMRDLKYDHMHDHKYSHIYQYLMLFHQLYVLAVVVVSVVALVVAVYLMVNYPLYLMVVDW